MSGGVNLHDEVRSAIEYLHPDEVVSLYQSTGQTNVAGLVTPTYAAEQKVRAQVQSANKADLEHAERIGMNRIILRFYLYAAEARPPAGIVRPFARNGDMIQRHDGTWWLVAAEPDGFAPVGWVCVLGVLQEDSPAGIPAAETPTEGE